MKKGKRGNTIVASKLLRLAEDLISESNEGDKNVVLVSERIVDDKIYRRIMVGDQEYLVIMGTEWVDEATKEELLELKEEGWDVVLEESAYYGFLIEVIYDGTLDFSEVVPYSEAEELMEEVKRTYPEIAEYIYY